jgi:carbon-monoxide dehydrogenase medium subunit
MIEFIGGNMWHEYITATKVDDVLQALTKYGPKAKIVAGATDLILEFENGKRDDVNVLIDVSRIPDQDRIYKDKKDEIHIGPGATHNHCIASELIRKHALPLAQATWMVGSPQIRNRGTVAGNIITASPANDTITPLMALDAKVTLRSLSGERIIPLEEFYEGVRRTKLAPEEMLVDISFPAMTDNQKGVYLKFALRRSQAISVVNAAMVLTFSDDNKIKKASITLGAVAPTIIHAKNAENSLLGKALSEENMKIAAMLAKDEAKPISDVRGSASFRKTIVKVLVERGLRAILNGTEAGELPSDPVLLWGNNGSTQSSLEQTTVHDGSKPIETTINGKKYVFDTGHDKSLLRLIREEAGLTGSKEGCAEGECGACTVHLDGIAVMSCMVPSPRAHGAVIETVEGLARNGQLHPLQETFIEDGAVQCGYCTPGFLMSAAKLLEEKESPDRDQIRQAITGNLCRCTGYYKILQAIEDASRISK